ncbi:MAG: hypothetical protein AAFP76_03015 [Bacteroidota bacterium]
MYRKLILLAFLCLFFKVQADPGIDSLKTRLNIEVSTEKKFNLLRDISHEFLVRKMFYDSAYIYARKAHTLAEENESKRLMARALFDIATIYLSSDYPDEALKYYSKTLEIGKDYKDHRLLCAVYNNMGGIYFDKQLFEGSKKFYDSSLVSAQHINDPYYIATSLINMSEIHYTELNYSKAERNILKTLHILDSISIETSFSHLLLGKTYLDTGRLELAKIEGLKGLKIAKRSKDQKYMYENYLLLAKITADLKEFESATRYSQLALAYNDSISKKKRVHEVEKLQLRLKVKEQEGQVSVLLEKNKYLRTIYIMIFIGVILLITLVSRQLKITKMTKVIHDTQNRLITQKIDPYREKNASTFDATVAGDKELAANALKEGTLH